MRLFAPLQRNGECFTAECHVIIQADLAPALFFWYRQGTHVPHPSHTTLVMDEIALAVQWFNGTWRPGLFLGASHGLSFISYQTGQSQEEVVGSW